MSRYLVTHVPHYIGGQYVEIGGVVTLPVGVKAGRWLKPLDDQQGADSAPTEKFKARHNGGGRWVVEDTDNGSRVALFEKDEGDAKAKAEAEAARLNAGGEVGLLGKEAETSSVQDDQAAGATQAGVLPDA